MSEEYIRHHFTEIRRHADAIEQRLDDSQLSQEDLICENAANLALCHQYNCNYLLIQDQYQVDWELPFADKF